MATSGRFSKTIVGCDFVNDYICTRCNMDNEAILYCQKCEVFYCKPCLQSVCGHHLLGKEDTDRWGKKAPAPVDAEVECPHHKGYRLDLYCRLHDSVCCSLCSQLDHKNCHMEFTPDVAKEMDFVAAEQDLQTHAKQLQQTADVISKDRVTRQGALQTRKATSLMSVQDFTRDMIEKLKSMEVESIKEIHNHAKSCDGELQTDLLCCGAAAADIAKIQQTASKKERDRVTGFIKMKNAKQLLNSTNKTLDNLSQKKKLDNENQPFRLNQDINTSISKFSRIGSFEAAPVRPSRVYKALNKGTISVRIQGDTNTCYIEGMCQLPDGSFVIADKANKTLKKLDQSYRVTRHCSLSDKPLGVCHIDGDEVAVAMLNRTIQFVSVGDSIIPTRSFPLDHLCFSLAHHQGRLYIAGGGAFTTESPAIHVYSLSGSRLRVIKKDQDGKNILYNPEYIALSHNGSTVYVTDDQKGLVTMDTQGHVLDMFSPSSIKCAVGVSVADDGSVFVGGLRSHNVIQVGKEGRRKLAEVVTSSAGIEGPNGICLDTQRSKLMVGMSNDDRLAVFDLTG